MHKRKLSLGAFVKAVSQAVTEANQKLVGEFIQRAAEAGRTEAACLPEPMCISRMRVSFSAHVARSDRILQESGTAELVLDFEKKGANFQGELMFQPFAQGAECYGDTEDTDDSKRVTIRPLTQTGGFGNGNR